MKVLKSDHLECKQSWIWYVCDPKASLILLFVFIAYYKHDMIIWTDSQYPTLECKFKDLKIRYNEESNEQKDLYNKLSNVKDMFSIFFIVHNFTVGVMVIKLILIFMLIR